jgi:hypothetical protein
LPARRDEDSSEPRGLEQLERIADEAHPIDETGLGVLEAIASLAMDLGSFDRALARWSRIAELRTSWTARTSP